MHHIEHLKLIPLHFVVHDQFKVVKFHTHHRHQDRLSDKRSHLKHVGLIVHDLTLLP